MKRLSIFLILAFLSSSCIVTKKKYDDMLAQKVKAEGELAQKSSQLDKAKADISSLNEGLEKLKRDTASLGDSNTECNAKVHLRFRPLFTFFVCVSLCSF